MNTEYYKGLTDGIIGFITSEEIYISQEKEFGYDTFVTDTNNWEIILKWCIGYEEANFKGDWLQPPDDDMPVYREVKLSFTNKTKIVEIIKDLRITLVEIRNSKEPETLEYDNSDELYEIINNK